MKNYSALLLRILLTLLVIYSVGAFLATGKNYVGKDFFDSADYSEAERKFLSGIEYYILNPSDQQASIDAIDVTADEIAYYRNYYGSEVEQKYSIQKQYEGKIAEARNVESPNEDYIEALIGEREAKIEEIRKNFADDQVVVDKIKALKTEVIRQYFAHYNQEKKEFLQEFDYYGYEFTNQSTNETIKRNEDEQIINRFKKTIEPTNVNERSIAINDYGEFANTVMEFNADTEGLLNKEILILSPQDTYSGTVYVTDQYIESSGLGWEYNGFIISKWLYYVLSLLGVIALIVLLTKYKWSKQLFEPLYPYYERLKTTPIDLHAAVLFIASFLTIATFDSGSTLISRIAYSSSHVLSLSFFIGFIVSFVFKLFILTVTIVLSWAIVKRFKEQKQLMLWKQSFSARLIELAQNLFLNRSIGIQTLFMFFVFYLGGFGLFIGLQESGLFAFYLFLFVTILVPTTFVYLYRMSYLTKIMKQTEQMANGQLTKPIKVKGKSPLAKHAANLNALQEGVKSSVTAQAKSERLKTELITNVSHDLRTPLTSIITYTDLLKNPDLTAEEREQYVAILDKKADRLKVLIDDLFEVSKMASGNIELVKQKVDIAQLIQQITGEYTNDFEEQQLDLRIDVQVKPIYAYVDGQKLWRVCENLLNNAKKYSMSGTRVYVTLTETNNCAVLTIKNVSKYELSGDAKELTERFKRADLARHTEGSGLGLAIATSIVHLHGGTLDITADGDLFKVTVELPC